MSLSMERHRVQLEGATIAYEVTGEGKPLILVHGLSGSGRWWRHNIAALAAHFRVYTIDLIGFGTSRGQRFELERASAYLAAWMQRLEIERSHLVGHSMGGFISADLAADHPALVDRLVLVDPALLLSGGLLPRAIGLLRAAPTTPFDFLPTLLYDALRAGPLTLTSAVGQLLRSDLAAKLALVQAPTLIIWGERDTLVPPDLAAPLAEALPAVDRVDIIRGAGHNPMWDKPEEFNRVVLMFLSKRANAQTSG